MKQREFSFVILVFVIGLIVRILFVLNSPSALSGDEIAYYSISERFLSKGVLLGSQGMPTAYRPPLYFLFLSLALALSNHSILIVKIVQAVLSLLTALVIFHIARKFLGHAISLITLLLSILYMPLIWAPTRLYSETLFLFFFTTAFYYFVKLWTHPAFSNSIKLGVFIGLAALTRGIAIVMMFLFISSLGIKYYSERILPFKKASSLLLAAAFSFSLTILPWVIRNYHLLGAPKFTTEAGMVWYTSFFPKSDKIFSAIPREDPVIQQAYALSTELEREQFLTSQTFSKLQKNPERVIKLIPIKFVSLWSPIHWEIYHTTVYDWSYVALWPFFFWGFLWLYRNKRNILLPIMMPMAGIIITSLIFYGSARLRFPSEPCFVLIASCAFHQAFQKRSVLLNLMISLWIMINFYTSFHYAEAKSFLKYLAVHAGIWS